MAKPNLNGGARVMGVRLTDIDIAVRRRRGRALYEAAVADRNLLLAVELKAAIERPSDRVYWVPASAVREVSRMTTFERELEDSVRRIVGRKVEHRFVGKLPDPSLTSPKLTAAKMLGEGRCRYCGVPHSFRSDGRPMTRHHLVPESWFLGQPIALRLIRNAHANIVPLCRPCHDRVDSKHPVVREDARRTLRASLTQQEIAFAIAVRGRSWLEREYPLDFAA